MNIVLTPQDILRTQVADKLADFLDDSPNIGLDLDSLQLRNGWFRLLWNEDNLLDPFIPDRGLVQHPLFQGARPVGFVLSSVDEEGRVFIDQCIVTEEALAVDQAMAVVRQLEDASNHDVLMVEAALRNTAALLAFNKTTQESWAIPFRVPLNQDILYPLQLYPLGDFVAFLTEYTQAATGGETGEVLVGG